MDLINPQNPFPEDGFIGSPEDYTGLHIEVMGEFSARKYIPKDSEVCISITATPSQKFAVYDVPVHQNFIDVLRLKFDDTAVDRKWDVFARSISSEQCQQVVEFVKKHADKNKLVIHCFAGVSRSRSMAAAIAEYLNLPFKFTVYNEHVYMTVMHAFKQTENPANV